jgi:hypothetical protein
MVSVLSKIRKENETKTPIVTHVTEVKIALEHEGPLQCDAITPAMIREAGKRAATHYARVAEMLELLAGLGFSFRADDKAVYCYSDEIEAGDVKKRLIAAGFRDREFQIVLEYTRGWGML